eukprot:CAMPEP_0174824294 /NCGR_PEP_ID=MMETSP1107-20130205/32751_1 /TAXON_ID=36770 /ORGANISM="Paraphysomonas vestita, Strain GFlagA" /LENGTH=705 /DNA_ID=CAMNT_0016050873 /DNA_START=746 /DNA_END=2863 /DNA_ORIENTATION=-
MPRISAIPPQILLAPTSSENPLIPVEEDPEPATKNAEVQTIYRESEAQTIPYSPEYILEEGADPEILMLRGLTYENGLPAGVKEIEMIEHARQKRELENNMLPFTDEACFYIRKNMMEAQELREFKLREVEVEAQRDIRLAKLKRALEEREESTEFLSSQRVEAIRQARMEIREKTLQKIRKKRINVLRKLARKRNTVDPVLSTSTARDIINDYFDRGSNVYAPQRRDGKSIPHESQRYDINGRTAPLSLLGNIEVLDSSIPRHYTTVKSKAPPAHIGSDNPQEVLLSKTAPLIGVGGGRAAAPRLTSAAQRSIRNTKKDIETMHVILSKKRAIRTGEHIPSGTSNTNISISDDRDGILGSTNNGINGGTGTFNVSGKPQLKSEGSIASDGNTNLDGTTGGPATTRNLLLNRKPKGRPRTPDYTTNNKREVENLPLYSAVVLLQKLIRGRAVQNSMFEGRYRRSELINELRLADEYEKLLQNDPEERGRVLDDEWADQIDSVKETTVESIAGSVTSNLLVLMVQEKGREEYYKELQNEANSIMEERKKRELAEAGRRQREGVPDLKIYSTKPPPEEVSTEEPPSVNQEMSELERIMTPVTTSFTDLVISSAVEKVAVNEVLNHLDHYPSLINAFKSAETSEEQEQICRDLIQALSTPRPASRGHLGGVFSPEASVANSNDIDASKEEVFQSVLSRLRSMLTTTEE